MAQVRRLGRPQRFDWIWRLVIVCAVGLIVARLAAQTDAETERWARVPEILKALDARPGTRIADVGAGDGFFTVRIARAVVPDGRVVGEDISESAVQKLRDRVAADHLTNVDAVLGSADDPRLSVETFDAVLVHNAYHEFVQHEQMLGHILSALKPGGRFVLVEPFHTSSTDLPREQQVAKHDLAADIAEKELRTAGFTIVSRDNEFVQFIGQPGGFWMIVARKGSEPISRDIRRHE
jgi:ubiquinone/menaquinone biosynthesis C-methylase UbiE